MQLVKYEAARRALSEACAVDEAKDIADKALALQQYAKQAQDKELEWHAAEIRIRAKRRIGELSAALEKATPGGAGGGSELPTAGKIAKSAALKEAGISTSEAHRCEKLAAVPTDKFEEYIRKQNETRNDSPSSELAARALITPLADHQRLNQSESNEWYTPPEIIEAARQTMGVIDLDPASSAKANETVGAGTFFAAVDDGLNMDWCGAGIWVNPPYGKRDGESSQKLWVEKAISEYKSGNAASICLLVNAVPGNAWFAPLWDYVICFPARRIRFVDENGAQGAPTHSNAIAYMGEDQEGFWRAFRGIGPVVSKIEYE